jgi:hypothetical protein
MLASQAVKFGYRWLVGNGEKVKFWKDIWFGTAPLAVQFWDLDCICYEKTKTVAEVWVVGELRFSFRRNFNEDMMVKWGELCAVVEQWTLVMNQMPWCGGMRDQKCTLFNPLMLWLTIGGNTCIYPTSVGSECSTKKSVISLASLSQQTSNCWQFK